MSIEIHLVLVWVVDLDLISVWGIKLYLISTRYRTFLLLCLGVKNDLVFASGSKVTWILCDDVRPKKKWSLDRYICLLCSRRPLSHG